MQALIENTKKGLQTLYVEHRFLLWLILYVWLITLTWSTIASVLVTDPLFIRGAVLLLIPALLGIRYAKRYSIAGKSRQHNYSTPITKLTEHQLTSLEQLVPTAQLDCFREVLLLSLNYYQVTLNQLSGQNPLDSKRTFDQKINEILDLLKHLNRLPTLYQQTSHQYRDLAITVFAFYRTLYSNVNQPLAWPSPHIFIKRTPLKLIKHLGSQSWRLFEFYEAILGNLNNLSLNHDIKSILSNIPILNQPVDKKEALAPFTSHNNEDMHNEDIMVSKKFLSWLLRKLAEDRRYRVNGHEFVFSEAMQYGHNLLFLSERVFNHYTSITQILPDQMRRALIATKQLSEKTYYVIQDQQSRSLWMLVGIQAPMEEMTPIKICEEK